MSFSFILVEPARAANVGAAARAIKTMGFTQLILINSSLHLADEAHWLAHGATDILDNVQIYPSLNEARSHFDLLIGTTARERGSAKNYLAPHKLPQIINDHFGGEQAIVFGRESSGLTNCELNLCDLYSYVPLMHDYPSINLAQAVMVYSYALSSIQRKIGMQNTAAPHDQLQALKDKANTLFINLEINKDNKLHDWFIDKLSTFDNRDCKMAHQFINDILKKL